MTEPPPQRASDAEPADLAALRGVRMNQMVNELYQWRAHRDRDKIVLQCKQYVRREVALFSG
ncbi:hypothetical protein [Streptomyces sp. NPDC020298]|uniref:hypothetical protein n=1 Tax=unclassified Streptomyces TaxID=2593676 RepID=UPI0033D9EB91